MKFIAFILGLLLIAGCAHVSTTSSPVNINGTWEGEYDSGMGGPPLFVSFSFICEGESLGGFVRGSFGPTIPGEWIPLENGKIKGNKISFTSTHPPKMGQPEMRFRFKGKIDGDKIKMFYNLKIHGLELSPIRARSRRGRPMDFNEGRRDIGKLLEAVSYRVGVNSLPSWKFTIERVK